MAAEKAVLTLVKSKGELYRAGSDRNAAGALRPDDLDRSGATSERQAVLQNRMRAL